MVDPIRWKDLTPNDQLTCIGRQRTVKFCSKYAWDAAGNLLTDWNDRINPQILAIITKNRGHIYKQGGFHAPLSIHLYLLATTPNQFASHPTIVIWTQDQKAAKAAKKIVSRHDLFIRLDTGFDIAYEKRSIFSRYGPSDFSLPSQMHQFSLGGTPIVTQPVEVAGHDGSNNPPTNWRRATIACCVSIAGRKFAVIPAHVFHPEEQSTQGYQDDNDDDVDDMDDEDMSFGPNSEDSGYSTQDDYPRHSTQCSSALPVKHAVYIDALLYNSFRNTGRTISTTSYGALIYLGEMDPSLEFPYLAHRTCVCSDLDYALIEIRHPFLQTINGVAELDGSSAQSSQPFSVRRTLSGELTLIAGTSGSHRVDYSGAAVVVLLPWSHRAQRVWEVDFSLAPGDSGSAVFDQDNDFIGMATATVPSANVSYVIPSESIFNCIAEQGSTGSDLLRPIASQGMVSQVSGPIKARDPSPRASTRDAGVQSQTGIAWKKETKSVDSTIKADTEFTPITVKQQSQSSQANIKHEEDSVEDEELSHVSDTDESMEDSGRSQFPNSGKGKRKRSLSLPSEMQRIAKKLESYADDDPSIFQDVKTLMNLSNFLHAKKSLTKRADMNELSKLEGETLQLSKFEEEKGASNAQNVAAPFSHSQSVPYKSGGQASEQQNLNTVPTVSVLDGQRELQQSNFNIEKWLNAVEPATSPFSLFTLGYQSSLSGHSSFVPASHLPWSDTPTDPEPESPPVNMALETSDLDIFLVSILDDHATSSSQNRNLPNAFRYSTPWQDPPQCNSSTIHSSQPPTASSAMMGFDTRATMWETASRAASWGSVDSLFISGQHTDTGHHDSTAVFSEEFWNSTRPNVNVEAGTLHRFFGPPQPRQQGSFQDPSNRRR